MKVAWLGFALVALVGLGGCHSVHIKDGQLPCSAKGECPGGYTCNKTDKRCYGNGHDGSADGHTGAAGAGGASGSGGTGVPDGGSGGGGAAGGDDDGGAGTCDGSMGCTPTNPCHLGTRSCATPSETCTDTAASQSDGTPCGAGMVCHAGACGACTDGQSCTLPDQPCTLGTTTCATGLPVCMQAGPAPEGKSCGTNMVCAAGSCVACAAGATCAPTNPCHAGKLTCAGVAACVDQTTAVADGTSCGTGMVCGQGTCAACAVGQSCAVTTACRVGMTTCNTGKALCVESGNAPDGQACGTGMVCKTGACITCAAGTACTPTNACHHGTISCTGGAVTCTDTGTALANGVGCGTDLVCSGGTCVMCAAGKACTPGGTTCKAGTTSCSTGASVCSTTGNLPDGTSCGASMVCSAGTCIACAAGGSCKPPTAPCHQGMLVCSSGAPVCTDTGTPLANGSTCGTTNLYCSGGTCMNCTPSQGCTPGGNVCQNGSTSCATGMSVCVFTTNVANGTNCGTGKMCSAGACVVRPNGATCSGGTDCGSGNCVDGVCCGASSCGTCQACNISTHAGTCFPKPINTADAACPASVATCMAGGCDGAGACKPVAVGTSCGASTCTNGSDALGAVAHAGQFVSAAVAAFQCNGGVGAAACVQKSGVSCPNSLVCNAAGAACKTSCVSHADCVRGSYCFQGQCAPSNKAGNDVCTDPTGIECATHVCSADLNNCQTCRGIGGTGTGNTCPITAPFCANYACVTCSAFYDQGLPICMDDGSYSCATGQASSACPSSAPNCDTNSNCVCGSSVPRCPGWMICINNGCKVAGGQPCVNATDCAYGTCTNGACPPTPKAALCTGDNPAECVAGSVCGETGRTVTCH